jgi:hypothetical protein
VAAAAVFPAAAVFRNKVKKLAETHLDVKQCLLPVVLTSM